MEKINVNKASATELQKIIHVGASRANKIIKARPIKDLYELSIIAGLGKKRMDDIIKQEEIVITI